MFKTAFTLAGASLAAFLATGASDAAAAFILDDVRANKPHKTVSTTYDGASSSNYTGQFTVDMVFEGAVSTYEVFCAERGVFVREGSAYDFADPDFVLSAVASDGLNALWTNAYSFVAGPDTPGNLNVYSAAFQTVAWELVEDGASPGADLSDGTFRLNGGANAASGEDFALADVASQWLDNILQGVWLPSARTEIAFLQSPDSQNLFFGRQLPPPVSEVPVPATVLLLGPALLGLAALRRRA